MLTREQFLFLYHAIKSQKKRQLNIIYPFLFYSQLFVWIFSFYSECRLYYRFFTTITEQTTTTYINLIISTGFFITIFSIWLSLSISFKTFTLLDIHNKNCHPFYDNLCLLDIAFLSQYTNRELLCYYDISTNQIISDVKCGSRFNVSFGKTITILTNRSSIGEIHTHPHASTFNNFVSYIDLKSFYSIIEQNQFLNEYVNEMMIISIKNQSKNKFHIIRLSISEVKALLNEKHAKWKILRKINY